jgi:hypothetical protein
MQNGSWSANPAVWTTRIRRDSWGLRRLDGCSQVTRDMAPRRSLPEFSRRAFPERVEARAQQLDGSFRHSVIINVVEPSLPGSQRTPCQPRGAAGSVKSYIHLASLGDKLMQPPLLGSPQSLCQ